MHGFEELTRDWKTRCRTKDGVHRAVRAECSLPVVGPFRDDCRRKRGQAVETAADLARFELGPMPDAVLMCGPEIESAHVHSLYMITSFIRYKFKPKIICEPVYDIDLGMEIRERVAFLTSHFGNLQGLRFAPIWVLFLFSPFIVKHQPAFGHLWSLPIAIAVWWFWIRWCSQLYVNRYGSVKAKTTTYLPHAWVLVISALYSVVCVSLHRLGWFPLKSSLALFCAWLADQVLTPTNPPIRRFYYSAGLLIAVGVFVAAFARLSTTWWANLNALLGLVLLFVSLLDHWLLMHTFSEISRGVDA